MKTNFNFLLIMTIFLSLYCQRTPSSSLKIDNEGEFSLPIPSKLRCFEQIYVTPPASTQLDAYYRGQENFPVIIAERSVDRVDQYHMSFDSRQAPDLMGRDKPNTQVFTDILGQVVNTNSQTNISFKVPKDNRKFTLSMMNNGVPSRFHEILQAMGTTTSSYSKISLECWTYSKLVPKIDETLFLNGDQRYTLKVSGLVPGKNMTAIKPDKDTNYLVISELSQNAANFLNREYKGCKHPLTFVPVMNKDADIVGWVTHMSKDQTGKLKGLMETVHGPKYLDKNERVISWEKGVRQRIHISDWNHDSWSPDLHSVNYRMQLATGLAVLCQAALPDFDIRPDHFFQMSACQE